MEDARIIGTIIIAIGSLISILAPIIKISSNITNIKSSIEHMVQNDKVRDERLNNHGKELDIVIRQVDRNGVTITNIEKQLGVHDLRIRNLESKQKGTD